MSHNSSLTRFLRRIATVAATVIGLALVITAPDAAATNTSGPAGTGSATSLEFATTCATQQVLYAGQLYCPGYVVGVKKGAYGNSTRVVLRSVAVTQVTSNAMIVQGGPSCLPDPSTFCGATIPSMSITLAGLRSQPRPGDVIDLYGVTGTTTLQPTGFIRVGFCDPDFGC